MAIFLVLTMGYRRHSRALGELYIRQKVDKYVNAWLLCVKCISPGRPGAFLAARCPLARYKPLAPVAPVGEADKLTMGYGFRWRFVFSENIFLIESSFIILSTPYLS